MFLRFHLKWITSKPFCYGAPCDSHINSSTWRALGFIVLGIWLCLQNLIHSPPRSHSHVTCCIYKLPIFTKIWTSQLVFYSELSVLMRIYSEFKCCRPVLFVSFPTHRDREELEGICSWSRLHTHRWPRMEKAEEWIETKQARHKNIKCTHPALKVNILLLLSDWIIF